MYLTTGERIRAWRTVLGRTLAEVADQVDGISVESLSKMERGLQKIPADLVRVIADKLGLSILQFYGRIRREVSTERQTKTQ